MLVSFSDKVVQVIEEWVPKRKYAKEGKYRDDLMKFLSERLKAMEGVGGYISGSSQEHVVKKARKDSADIVVDKKIGIELKLNLKQKTEMDRLYGQVRGFLDEYSCVIVVLCGDVEQEKIDVLKDKFRELVEMENKSCTPWSQEKFVRIISTEKKEKKGEPDFGEWDKFIDLATGEALRPDYGKDE